MLRRAAAQPWLFLLNAALIGVVTALSGGVAYLSSRFLDMMGRAEREAERDKATEVGVEHLLNALSQEIRGAAGEILGSFGVSPGSTEELARQARAVFEQHRPGSIIITCGKLGILAITPSGSYLARAPSQIVVNTAGAGDAVSAALAWQLSAGADWTTALQWAAAAGAAVVLTEGTADCRRSDIERIYPEVIVQNIPGAL